MIKLIPETKKGIGRSTSMAIKNMKICPQMIRILE
jgi:hypothetical protein